MKTKKIQRALRFSTPSKIGFLTSENVGQLLYTNNYVSHRQRRVAAAQAAIED